MKAKATESAHGREKSGHNARLNVKLKHLSQSSRLEMLTEIDSVRHTPFATGKRMEARMCSTSGSLTKMALK